MSFGYMLYILIHIKNRLCRVNRSKIENHARTDRGREEEEQEEKAKTTTHFTFCHIFTRKKKKKKDFA